VAAFDAGSMFGACDPSTPRTAAICDGDEGGPLVGPGPRGSRLYGIASWHKRCGEHGSPSVFSNVWRDRSIILATNPTWRPVITGVDEVQERPGYQFPARVAEGALVCRVHR
jgi:secreted trypsin-like serine protease